MAQKKTTSTPKTKAKAAVKRAPKAAAKTSSKISVKSTGSLMSSSPGQSFDVIPAHKVVPSSSARPVITSTKPAQADNTLTKRPSVMLKAPVVHDEAPHVNVVAKHTMAAAPRDISSGDVLLEDIAASLEKLQPITKPDDNKFDRNDSDGSAGTRITVKASGPLTAPTLATTPAGPTVAELLTAQSKAAPEVKPAPAPPTSVVIAPTTTVGERKIMPLSEAAKKADVTPADKTHHKPDVEHHTAKVHKSDKAPVQPAERTVDKSADSDSKSEDRRDEKISDVLDGLDLDQDRKPATASGAEASSGEAVLPGKTDQSKQAASAELYGGSSVLLIHEPHPVRTTFKYIFGFIGLLILALIILNFLLDAGVVSTGYDIPYTDVLDP